MEDFFGKLADAVDDAFETGKLDTTAFSRPDETATDGQAEPELQEPDAWYAKDFALKAVKHVYITANVTKSEGDATYIVTRIGNKAWIQQTVLGRVQYTDVYEYSDRCTTKQRFKNGRAVSTSPYKETSLGQCLAYQFVSGTDIPIAKPRSAATVQKTTDGTICGRPCRIIEEKVDEHHRLLDVSFKNIEHFNFAFDIVDEIAKKSPEKTAMQFVSRTLEPRTFTFADMSRESSRTANYFKSLGIKRGDRVMLVLRRNYQFWFSVLELHKIGAIAIPATDLLMAHDFTYRFDAAGVSAIVCTADGSASGQVDLIADQSKTLKTRILVGAAREGWHDFNAEYTAFSDEYPRPDDAPGGDDSMLMFFTSGTTGYPKIATHNFKYPLGHFITAKYWHNVDPNGLHFTVADTGWGKALWGKLYGQWMCEAATFTFDFDRFDAATLLPMIAQYHITTFCTPPTIYRFFIKEDLSQYDLSSLKYATVAGEALNQEVFNQFIKATGIPLMEGFGQTETTLTVGNFVGSVVKPGSMGKPSPLYDVDIVLPDGTPTKAGEVGEIIVRTDNRVPCGLFKGYYLDDEKTRDVWHDGAYHTGDTAWRDQDGFFWYVGRVDDLIKSSGYRIGPFEIESVLMELPYVLECAVTAAPDEIRGQVVKATIVLTKGTKPSEELKKEIQTYVKTNTAPYKYPRIVEFRDELPKTISGKIRRVDLR
ncbi:MAG: AMP-binding protein [Clostridia bacterium]|nr:AMP-binding protein [Clostridia bacterium]